MFNLVDASALQCPSRPAHIGLPERLSRAQHVVSMLVEYAVHAHVEAIPLLVMPRVSHAPIERLPIADLHTYVVNVHVRAVRTYIHV